MEFVFIFVGVLIGAGICMCCIYGFNPIEKENYEWREKWAKINQEIEQLRKENRGLNKTLSMRSEYLNRTNPQALRWLELNRTVDELSQQKLMLTKDKLLLESDIAALEKLLQERKQEYFNDNSKN